MIEGYGSWAWDSGSNMCVLQAGWKQSTLHWHDYYCSDCRCRHIGVAFYQWSWYWVKATCFWRWLAYLIVRIYMSELNERHYVTFLSLIGSFKLLIFKVQLLPDNFYIINEKLVEILSSLTELWSGSLVSLMYPWWSLRSWIWFSCHLISSICLTMSAELIKSKIVSRPSRPLHLGHTLRHFFLLLFNFLGIIFVFVNMGPHGSENFKTLLLQIEPERFQTFSNFFLMVLTKVRSGFLKIEILTNFIRFR